MPPFLGRDFVRSFTPRSFRVVQKRQLLVSGLARSGILPLEGQGGFFLMANTSALHVPQTYLSQPTPACPAMTRDWAFCRWIAKEAGVIAIPASPFFSAPNKHLARDLVRFAFCKSDATILEACERLELLARSAA